MKQSQYKESEIKTQENITNTVAETLSNSNTKEEILAFELKKQTDAEIKIIKLKEDIEQLRSL